MGGFYLQKGRNSMKNLVLKVTIQGRNPQQCDDAEHNDLAIIKATEALLGAIHKDLAGDTLRKYDCLIGCKDNEIIITHSLGLLLEKG